MLSICTARSDDALISVIDKGKCLLDVEDCSPECARLPSSSLSLVFFLNSVTFISRFTKFFASLSSLIIISFPSALTSKSPMSLILSFKTFKILTDEFVAFWL